MKRTLHSSILTGLIAVFFLLGTSSIAFAQKKGNTQPGTSIPQQIDNLQLQIDTIELTPGPQGEQGIQGIPGGAGTNGTDGTNGVDGQDGADGADGADSTVAGPVGPQGPAGPQGTTGARGPMGLQGSMGAQGADGLQGPKGDPGDSHSGAIYRWAVWMDYDNGGNTWFAGNNGALFGGVRPQQWGDGNGRADMMSDDMEVLRSLFTRKGYAGKNALVVAEQWIMFSSTTGKHAAALFRIKNTTSLPITWGVTRYHTGYGGWSEVASVAVNGQLVWNSGSSSLNAQSGFSHDIVIPPNQTSTVIFISSSGIPTILSGGISVRALFLGFVGNTLELPVGLEYVDDLDTAQ